MRFPPALTSKNATAVPSSDPTVPQDGQGVKNSIRGDGGKDSGRGAAAGVKFSISDEDGTVIYSDEETDALLDNLDRLQYAKQIRDGEDMVVLDEVEAGETARPRRSFAEEEGLFDDDTKPSEGSFQQSLLAELEKSEERAAEKAEEETAKVLTNMPKEKRRSVKEVYRAAKRQTVDVGEAFDRMKEKTGDKMVYARYNNAKQGNAIAGEMVYGDGQYNLDNERVGKSLTQIFEPIFKRSDSKEDPAATLFGKAGDAFMNRRGDSYLQAFSDFLMETHNIDRLQYDKPVTGKKAAESEKTVASLLKKYPEFEGYAEEVYQFNRNLLQYMVDGGLIDDGTAKAWMEKYPHYVPTFRVKVDEVSGKIRYTHIIHEAEGGTDDIVPVFLQMERRAREIVKNVKKNQLAQVLTKHYIKDPEAVKAFVYDIKKMPLVNGESTVEEMGTGAAAEGGVYVRREKGGKKSEDKADKGLEDKVEDGPFIPLYVEGQIYRMTVSDDILQGYEAIGKRFVENDFLAAARTANNVKRALVTTYNPVFTFTNGIKDLQDLFIYNQHAHRLPGYYGRALGGITGIGRNKKLQEKWKQYLAMGASNASIFEYESTRSGRRGMAVVAFDKTIGMIDAVNFAVEQAPRFAVYLETLNRIGDTPDNRAIAMLAAADATLNFGRSGTTVKALNTYGATFLNAGVQGMDRLGRTVKQVKGETARETAVNAVGLMVKCAILGIAPAVIGHLFFAGDDEADREYQEMSEHTKINNYILHIGGRWIKIPKGRVLAFISSFFFTGNAIKNGEMSINEAIGAELAIFTDTVAPSNPLTSNIVAPFIEIIHGKNWYGEDIVPERLADYSPICNMTRTRRFWPRASPTFSIKSLPFMTAKGSDLICRRRRSTIFWIR